MFNRPSKLILSLFVFSIAATSCTKEHTVEKIIIPERQAPATLNRSVTIKQNQKNIISLKKESLGKAFILVPLLYNSSNKPEPRYVLPMIISFEKSGDRIGLFNLTEPQLYDTIKSDRLLQTFAIKAETEDTIEIDLEKGFTSLNIRSDIYITEPTEMATLNQKIQDGNESSIEVKDSFIRNAQMEKNSIFIEQVMRIKTNDIKEKLIQVPAEEKKKPVLALESFENTHTAVFEIKPYIQNKNFESKIFDIHQNFGYFINFATKNQDLEMIPQITKWDIDPSRGPIQVRLQQNTPETVTKTIEEGILYWNKVFGKNVLEIGSKFRTDEYQSERTIFVYWIPWDSAGFAYAGIQADPLTGEIFRGQIYMTSSWYKLAKDEVRLSSLNSAVENQRSHLNCIIDQKKMFGLDSLKTKNPGQIENNALDIIRNVIAHEMGHVFGLRHNFAGSATSNKTDEELQQYRAQYRAGNSNPDHFTSSTIMDYTKPIDSAIDGNYIKNNALAYDKAVIQWGYFNNLQNAQPNGYCSDEHIMYAENREKEVYGCARFDINKNQINGELERTKEEIRNMAIGQFRYLLQKRQRNKSYYATDLNIEDDLAQMSFAMNRDLLAKYIYAADYGKLFFSIPYVIKQQSAELANFVFSNSDYSGFSKDYSVTALIEKDASEVHGYAGVLDSILGMTQKDPHYFENQVLRLFENISHDDYKKFFTEKDLLLIKEKMLTEAQKKDKTFIVDLILAFPPISDLPEYDTSTRELKNFERPVSDTFKMGDLNVLLRILASAYQTSLQNEAAQIEINGKTLSITNYQTNLSSIPNLIRALFVAPQYMYLRFGKREELNLGLTQFKRISARNSLQLLEALNIPAPQEITSESLKLALNKVDWNLYPKLYKTDFSYELEELERWSF